MKFSTSILIFFVFIAGCAIASSDAIRGKGSEHCKPKSSDLPQHEILAIAKANLVLPKAELEKAEFFLRRQDNGCGWSVVVHPQTGKPGGAVHFNVSNDGKKVDLMPSW